MKRKGINEGRRAIIRAVEKCLAGTGNRQPSYPNHEVTVLPSKFTHLGGCQRRLNGFTAQRRIRVNARLAINKSLYCSAAQYLPPADRYQQPIFNQFFITANKMLRIVKFDILFNPSTFYMRVVGSHVSILFFASNSSGLERKGINSEKFHLRSPCFCIQCFYKD